MFRKRNLLIAVATFVIGVGAFAAIWGVPRLLRRSTSINGQVTAYLLDERGNVNGLLLTTGDQLRFSPETGTVVASQIKVGDQVAVSGHAGSQSSYGREVRVEQISANGRTITEARMGPSRPHGPDDKRGPGDREGRGNRPGPSDHRAQDGALPPSVGAEAKAPESTQAPVNAPGANPAAANDGQAKDPNARSTENAPQESAPLQSPEIFKAAGTIRTHLVNGHGDVVGLILSNGEQVRFPPRVGELVVASEQDANTQVSLEGNAVRNERGTVIRPSQITVGSQTIALGE